MSPLLFAVLLKVTKKCTFMEKTKMQIGWWGMDCNWL